MADEISITAEIRAQKGFIDVQRLVRNLQVDLTGETFSWVAQEIATTYESVDISAEVATAGYAWFRNLDDTNFIEIGLEVSAAFESFAKLLPGQVALVPLTTTSIFAKADTAAAKLEHLVLSA